MSHGELSIMPHDKNQDLSMSGLSPKEKMLLKFMSSTIERINSCLINIHALQALLIKKGVFTQSELCSEVKDAEMVPTTTVGKNVLEISTIISICDFVDAFLNRKTEIKDGSDAGVEKPDLKSMLYKKYPNDHATVDVVLSIAQGK